MLIMRVGPTTNRVIRGNHYELREGHIIDEEGNKMKPQWHNKNYWQEIKLSEPAPHAEIEINEHNADIADSMAYTFNQFKEMSKTKEKQTMLTIERVTLINDRKESKLSDNEIINLIVEQEILISKLEEIKTESEAIKKLKAKHTDNISQLVFILDGRDKDEL